MVDIPANNTTSAVLDFYYSDRSHAGTFSGALEVAGDHDWIKVELEGGKTYEFLLSFLESGSVTAGDAFLRVFDAQGTLIGANNDAGAGENAYLALNIATAGTYYIDVGENGDNAVGDYSVLVATKDGLNVTFLTDGNEVYTGATDAKIAGGKGADTITLGAAYDAAGEQGNDIITGNNQVNHISGGLGDDTIYGLAEGDLLFGDAGNDVIFGGSGADEIVGGTGNDILNGESGSDHIYAGAGNDFVHGGADNDHLHAGEGIDHLSGDEGNDYLYAGGSDGISDTFNGGAGVDTLICIDATLSGFNATSSEIETLYTHGTALHGTSQTNVFDFSGLSNLSALPFVDAGGGNDAIIGSIFAEDLRGGSGKDTLNGMAGADILTGGAGRDISTGGAGSDLFDFNSIRDSKKGGQRDVITDLQRGQDDIDLRGIDAKSGGGNQAFKFIGKQDFHDRKGELRYEDKGSKVIVQGDVNGDGKADFEIFVKVGALSAGDFLL